MRTTRIVLVLMLLAAIASTAEAQLLPRRRVGTAVAKFAADFTFDALNQGLNQAMNELGDALNVQLALELFAQIQMDPAARERLCGELPKDQPTLGTMDQLLSETATFAAKLADEQYSSPQLEKMVLDYYGLDPNKTKVATAQGKSTPWSSRQVYQNNGNKKGTSPQDLASRPSVTFVERHQPHDPRKLPSVHCSLVFVTTKDNQEAHQTLDFDLVLEQRTKAGPLGGNPWKLKHVQYNQPLPAE